eukprot:gene10460-12371_t
MGFMATAVMEVLMLEYVALAGVEGMLAGVVEGYLLLSGVWAVVNVVAVYEIVLGADMAALLKNVGWCVSVVVLLAWAQSVNSSKITMAIAQAPCPTTYLWGGSVGTAVAGCMLDSTNGVDTVHLQVMTMVTSIAVKVAATAIAVMRAVWKVMDVPMRGDTMNVPTGLLASLFVIP